MHRHVARKVIKTRTWKKYSAAAASSVTMASVWCEPCALIHATASAMSGTTFTASVSVKNSVSKSSSAAGTVHSCRANVHCEVRSTHTHTQAHNTYTHARTHRHTHARTGTGTRNAAQHCAVLPSRARTHARTHRGQERQGRRVGAKLHTSVTESSADRRQHLVHGTAARP